MSDADRDRWDARWRERGQVAAPSPFIVGLDPILPRRGRALDVAGGAGRHALWLAGRGLDVTLVDVSAVGLALARAAADSAGLALTTARLDLDRDPVPAGPWDVIVCFHFLLRPLWAELPAHLAPGGVLVLVQPTRANLERHARPGPAHLLDEGELPGLVRGLDVVSYAEGWLDEGRHEARLVARRSAR